MVNMIYKSSNDYPQKAKGMSFFAFMVSVVIYICVFYIFNLSPSSTLLSNHKFLFFISNTLILIIAADYGAYTSSRNKGKLDIYDDYLVHNRRVRDINNPSSFVSSYQEIVDKNMNNSTLLKEEASKVENNPTSIMYNTVADDDLYEKKQEEDIVPKKLSLKNIRKNENEPKEKMVILEYGKDLALVPCKVAEKKKKKTYKRSKSNDQTKKVVLGREGKSNILYPSISEKVELDHTPIDEEDQENINDEGVDEFTTMSNEELKRRVEEFIKKFNREIRLQNTTRKYQLQ